MELLGLFQPEKVIEAKIMLSEFDNLKLMAGGTDLVLELRREKEKPQYILDLGRIQELKIISEDDSNIYVGSMVTFTNIKKSSIISKNFNTLIVCAENMGSPQIRNVATIGGNIVNAGSAADIVPCVVSLGGILIIEAIDSLREVSCENYFKNYEKEKIKRNEILTKIIFPKKNEISGYYKLGKRNSLAIARVSASISLKLEANKVKNIAVCLGAVGRFPIRAYELEKHADNETVDWLFSDEPLNYLENIVEESIKGRKTMPFKKEAIKGVYKEALRIALGSNMEVNK
jgi:CO/xanthine dehydrogenase FAD-binding subunit